MDAHAIQSYSKRLLWAAKFCGCYLGRGKLPILIRHHCDGKLCIRAIETRGIELVSLLTKKSVAEFAGVSPGTISRWVRDGIIPCIRIGYRTLRFNLEDVVRSLQDRFGR
jgi:excisionase family DNA binding protein